MCCKHRRIKWGKEAPGEFFNNKGGQKDKGMKNLPGS
jgi:hypothetical protein